MEKFVLVEVVESEVAKKIESMLGKGYCLKEFGFKRHVRYENVNLFFALFERKE